MMFGPGFMKSAENLGFTRPPTEPAAPATPTGNTVSQRPSVTIPDTAAIRGQFDDKATEIGGRLLELPALVLLPFQLALLWSIIAEDNNALVDVRCGNYIRALF